MNRRDLLATLPALAVAAPSAAVSDALAAPSMTPIAQAYREIIRRRDFIETNADSISEADCSVLHEKMMRIADDIVDMPTHGPMDFIFKLLGHTVNGDFGTTECPRGGDLLAEAVALVGQA